MNKAIILDITYGGYGIAKSLSRFGIHLIGFYNINEKHLPEVQTTLCEKISYEYKEDLLLQLKDISEKDKRKPVLFLNADIHVELFNEHREFFETNFLVNVPDNEVIDAFLYKENFYKFAINNNLPIPISKHIYDIECIKDLTYPIFVKPVFKWSSSQKGIICNNDYEVSEIFKFSDSFIAQEFIPGPTTNIYTIYVYYDKNSNCIASIGSIKIREWPDFGGTGTCLKVIKDSDVFELANKFFKSIKYKGFGSIEIKRHEITKKLYIIEPTVGRVDANSDFVYVNGINMPAIHYSILTGNSIPDLIKETKDYYWIYESLDLPNIIKAIRGKKVKMFLSIIKTYLIGKWYLFNIKDKTPFLYFLKRNILKIS